MSDNRTGERVRGVTGRWSEKGYCFVSGPKGERIFLHVTDCPDECPLETGQVVELTLTMSAKGFRGHDVTLVNTATAQE